jgi:hypothetical protein
MNERRVRDQVRVFDSRRQRQRRWRRGDCRICQRDDGANRTNIVRMLILIVARRRLLLGGLDRWRDLRCDGMEVAERKPKLDDERKQCNSRTKFDVRPDPLHADNAPRRKQLQHPAASTLQHNIANAKLRCQHVSPGKNS